MESALGLALSTPGGGGVGVGDALGDDEDEAPGLAVT
jgi:hypothetical protein